MPAILLAGCLALVTACTAGEPDDRTAPSRPTQAARATSDWVDVAQRLAPSVVTVRHADGLGSGVVLKPDVVVTNQHVVGDRERVELVFADGRRADGQVIAGDATTDLAVIRSSRTDLPVPEFRTSLPSPGEAALAIGSPLGFENSVTAGIISGLHREIPGSARQTRSLVDLIQTDAPISPGNSGGALVGAQGRVIGINEAYIPPRAGAVSLGFAIPSATVLDVTEQLLANGRVDHPYLGLSLAPLTPAIRERLGVGIDHGAVVTGVDPNGPASDADVRPGDIVVRLGDDPVRTVEDVLAALRNTEPGQRTQLTVARGSDRIELAITIGSSPR